jgi:hypothetical protein
LSEKSWCSLARETISICGPSADFETGIFYPTTITSTKTLTMVHNQRTIYCDPTKYRAVVLVFNENNNREAHIRSTSEISRYIATPNSLGLIRSTSTNVVGADAITGIQNTIDLSKTSRVRFRAEIQLHRVCSH